MGLNWRDPEFCSVLVKCCVAALNESEVGGSPWVWPFKDGLVFSRLSWSKPMRTWDGHHTGHFHKNKALIVRPYKENEEKHQANLFSLLSSSNHLVLNIVQFPLLLKSNLYGFLFLQPWKIVWRILNVAIISAPIIQWSQVLFCGFSLDLSACKDGSQHVLVYSVVAGMDNLRMKHMPE